MTGDPGMAARRSAAIRNGMEQARASGSRLGRPSTAPDKTWLRIAELADTGLDNGAIAERLNREGVKTLSGEGQWNADRVKHARRSPRYDAAVDKARDDEVPLTRRTYMAASRLILGDRMSDVAVLVPLGLRAAPEPEVSQCIRRALRENKYAIPIGPDEQVEIMWTAPLWWQQYEGFAKALRDIKVARADEFVCVNGIDRLNLLPRYTRQLSDVKTGGRPVLQVELHTLLTATLFYRALHRMDQPDAELKRGISILQPLGGWRSMMWIYGRLTKALGGE